MDNLDADALGRLIAGIGAIGVVTAAVSKLGGLLGLDSLRAEVKDLEGRLDRFERECSQKLHAFDVRLTAIETKMQGVAADVDRAANETGNAAALLRELREAIPGARNARR